MFRLFAALLGCLATGALATPETQTRYLLFQVFTAAAEPAQALGGQPTLTVIPDRATLEKFARDIKDPIGFTGDKRRKLGFVPGPLALDHTDQQAARLIRDAFSVARTLDMAVAFHLDDSMFWARHPGLQQDDAHLEWTDWKGTKNTGRRIDWGPKPAKIAPQLCFNSAPVVKAVKARAAAVKEFMELWAASMGNEGVPQHLIYNHIAFTAQGLSGNKSDHPPGETAFSSHYRPGFSTYPAPGAIAEIHALLKSRGSPPWASVEGTNVIPNGMPGENTMETYLGRMFNHGAVMVNIFSWGVGPDDPKRNLFRRPTQGPDAIAGYRIFLSGENLREDPAMPFSLAAFQEKRQAIQARLPPWVQRTRRQREAEALMRRLDGHVKSGNLASADAVADEVLRLLAQ